MRLSRRRSSPANMLFAFAIAIYAACSTLAADELKITLRLGSDKAIPGAWVVVPITLEAPDDKLPSALTVDVSFPSKLLSFQVVRKPEESSPMDIDASVVADASNPQMQIARVKIAAHRGMALRSGVIARVVFQIDPAAPAMQKIQISSQVTNASSFADAGRSLLPIGTEAGEIHVTGGIEAAFSCFFYMH